MPRREFHDRYFRQAKAEGYLARSAYKLIEIDDRTPVLGAGARVADLGCAPGSWLQVASERVGERGVVVGVDLTPVRATMPPRVRTIEADVFEPGIAEKIRRASGDADRALDLVLSDMAPSTSGAGDHFASAELCERVLELARDLLRPGGNLVMKIFEGERYPELLALTASWFAHAKGFKPKATRGVSREMYIVARGLEQRTPAQGRSRRAGER